ncbi:MAG: hypothetical protein ACKN89_11220 [Cyanobium sp.]
MCPWQEAVTQLLLPAMGSWKSSGSGSIRGPVGPAAPKAPAGVADVIRHFLPLSAIGARQHPQQVPLLSGEALLLGSAST